VSLLIGAAGFVRLCTSPLDLNAFAPTTHGTPANSLLGHPAIAYPAHAIAGSLLERFGCDARATAVQWFKAAWHAHHRDELDAAAAGLRLAASRAGGPQVLGKELCGLIRDSPNWSQQQALLGAGMACQARWGPAPGSRAEG
jgi:hypothetical protein